MGMLERREGREGSPSLSPSLSSPSTFDHMKTKNTPKGSFFLFELLFWIFPLTFFSFSFLFFSFLFLQILLNLKMKKVFL